MSLSAAVGAPAPIEIGDKKFSASPLDLFNLGSIEETVRALLLNAAAKGAIGLPDEIGDKLIDRALAKAMGVAYYSPETRAYLKTPKGGFDLIELSLKPLHPEMTAAAIGRVLSKRSDQYRDAIGTIFRISGFNSPDVEEEPAKGEAGAGTA